MRAALLVAAVLAFASVARAQDAGPAAPERHNVRVNIGSDDGGDASSVIASLPPDVRARLTGDQVEQIMRRSQEARVSSSAATIVPAAFFIAIVGIVVAVLIGRHRRERILHETLRAMIEKGAEIPPQLLGADKRKPDDRRRGLILVGAGVGLSAFLAVVDRGDGSWAFGLVPLLIGIGYLVAFILEKRDRA